MCGIVGYWAAREGGAGSRAVTQGMADTLAHRGPDAGAVWSEGGLALGHRRLSVVDLSQAGAQPMVSACGRYVIVYNGEIYTAADMRADLPHIAFRGHSDTEAILEGCAAWGVEATGERLIGMFAFALWDRQERCLTLARDRLGIKPLYWTRMSGAFLFGSELKALRAWPDFRPQIDRAALAAYFRHTYIPAPATIFEGVHKLEPGHILTLADGREPEIRSYWSLRQKAVAAAQDRFTGSEEDLVTHLDGLLGDAVERRMVADVPLGAFLSGGVDSSLVAALMQARSSRPIKTYTMAFDVPGYDESAHAAAVARHLGTEHHEMPVTARDALDVVPSLAEWYDEPFADSSQIPTYLVSKLARRHVTVALSGDGGDELFAGYDRYARVENLWRRTGGIPYPLRRAGGGLAGLLGGRIGKAGEVLACRDADALFHRIVSVWPEGQPVRNAGVLRTRFDDPALVHDLPGLLDRMLYLDSVTHLPDDILTKVDRASMAASLETRVPLLDHRVAEFAFRLPDELRRRDGKGKWPLRQVLYRYVPETLIERPKMGFMVPVGHWLRSELRDWAEDLLRREALEDGGLLDSRPILDCWRQHLAGSHDWTTRLWTVLMAQAWRRRWSV